MTEPAVPPVRLCVIDDDAGVRGSLESFLRAHGYDVATFASPAAFLASGAVAGSSCLLLDIQLGTGDGLDFQQELLDDGIAIPIILISGHGDIPQTVRAMKAGAVSFLTKPIDDEALLAAIAEALDVDRERRATSLNLSDLQQRYATLTSREREVMALVTAGLMNKQVAARLSLSDITVKIHRGSVMRKMKAQSLADLVRMAEDLDARDLSAARFRPHP
jgi:FixJ family two-component response regulator